MAFNIFKKKESKETPKETLRQAQSKEKEIAKKTPEKTVVAGALSLPHISEKARMLQAQNQYVFKVIPGATKYGVKNSVEAQYGVKVEKVAMIRVPSKSIRVGKRMGERQGYKKAVVKLKKGYKIETIQ